MRLILPSLPEVYGICHLTTWLWPLAPRRSRLAGHGSPVSCLTTTDAGGRFSKFASRFSAAAPAPNRAEPSCAKSAPALTAAGNRSPKSGQHSTDAGSCYAQSLDSTDNVQEDAKTDAAGGTSARNRVANDLYDRLLTIQNAANLQWPEINSANDTLRAKFRLGIFPPPRPSGPDKPTPPPTPPTT